jgi:hypothetical protein
MEQNAPIFDLVAFKFYKAWNRSKWLDRTGIVSLVIRSSLVLIAQESSKFAKFYCCNPTLVAPFLEAIAHAINKQKACCGC